jgi:hypothetical protein
MRNFNWLHECFFMVPGYIIFNLGEGGLGVSDFVTSLAWSCTGTALPFSILSLGHVLKPEQASLLKNGFLIPSATTTWTLS